MKTISFKLVINTFDNNNNKEHKTELCNNTNAIAISLITLEY
jgi:hypothetical protein